MARLVASITVVHVGLDQCVAAMGSIAEAASNAHCDLEELECQEGVVTFNGMQLTTISMRMVDWTMTVHVSPEPGLILFVSWLMTVLPSTATVTWREGWPHVYCPPRDDRDEENDPTLLTPNELVSA